MTLRGTDIGDGPFADGIWAFNYFFYNEDIKRLCFFFCKAEIVPIAELGCDDDCELEMDHACQLNESDSGSSFDMEADDSESED